MFYNAIQKYGWDNFKHIILEENISIDKLNEREEYWIKYYQSDNRKYGYNLTIGGTGQLNQQQKQNRQDKLKQWRNQHPEQVQNSINKMQKYWKEHPEEKKEVLKKATQKSIEYWKQHPKEKQVVMEKMRNEAKKKTTKSVICVETGCIYESAREAHRQTGVYYGSISKCCTGKQLTAGGYHWQFYMKE